MTAAHRQAFGLALTVSLSLAPTGAQAGRMIGLAVGDNHGLNEAARVVVDGKGHVYLVGTAGSAVYGQVRAEGSGTSGFIGKYTPQGKLLWGRQLNQPNLHIRIKAAAVDGNYLYAVGERHNPGVSGTAVGFITKLNAATGIPLWTQLIEPATATPDAGLGVSDIRFDSRHIARIVGWTNAGLRFNGQTIPGGGCTDGFLLAMTRTGATKEVPIVLGGPGDDDCVTFEGIRLDSNDDLYVTGASSVSLFGQTVTGASDLLIAKAQTYPVTSWKWGRLYGQPNRASDGLGVAIAELQSQGYVAGIVQGIESSDRQKGTLMAFDTATGSARWTHQVESTKPEGTSMLVGVDVDPSGAAIAVGSEQQGEGFDAERGLALRYGLNGDLLRSEYFGNTETNTRAIFVGVTQKGWLSYLSGLSSFGLLPDAPLPPDLFGTQAIATTYTLGSTPTARDNNVTIAPSFSSTASDWSFTWSGLDAYTSGQPFDGVQSVPLINGGVEIDVNAGRQGSYPPAQWFMQQITAQALTEDGNSNTPSNLNFAITGTLTIGSASYPIALGQGRSYSNIVGNNNWWLGGTAPGFVYVQNFYYPPGCGAPGTPACQYEGGMALITPDSQYAITPSSQDAFRIYPAN